MSSVTSSVTGTYAAIHRAFAAAADRYALTGTDVRVLVALLDRGGTASLVEIAGDVSMLQPVVRRSSLTLRIRGLVRAERSPAVRFSVLRVTLTEHGEALAAAVVAQARSIGAVAA